MPVACIELADSSEDEDTSDPVAWRMPRRIVPPERRNFVRPQSVGAPNRTQHPQDQAEPQQQQPQPIIFVQYVPMHPQQHQQNAQPPPTFELPLGNPSFQQPPHAGKYGGVVTQDINSSGENLPRDIDLRHSRGGTMRGRGNQTRGLTALRTNQSTRGEFSNNASFRGRNNRGTPLNKPSTSTAYDQYPPAANTSQEAPNWRPPISSRDPRNRVQNNTNNNERSSQPQVPSTYREHRQQKASDQRPQQAESQTRDENPARDQATARKRTSSPPKDASLKRQRPETSPQIVNGAVGKSPDKANRSHSETLSLPPLPPSLPSSWLPSRQRDDDQNANKENESEGNLNVSGTAADEPVSNKKNDDQNVTPAENVSATRECEQTIPAAAGSLAVSEVPSSLPAPGEQQTNSSELPVPPEKIKTENSLVGPNGGSLSVTVKQEPSNYDGDTDSNPDRDADTECHSPVHDLAERHRELDELIANQSSSGNAVKVKQEANPEEEEAEDSAECDRRMLRLVPIASLMAATEPAAASTSTESYDVPYYEDSRDQQQSLSPPSSPQFYTPTSPEGLNNDENWDAIGEYSDPSVDDEEDEIIRPIPDSDNPPPRDSQEFY